MVSLGVSLDTPAFHASCLCKPVRPILISLCSNDGAITLKLGSLNQKHFCFTHGSMAVALLNAAGLGWTWLQACGKDPGLLSLLILGPRLKGAPTHCQGFSHGCSHHRSGRRRKSGHTTILPLEDQFTFR